MPLILRYGSHISHARTYSVRTCFFLSAWGCKPCNHLSSASTTSHLCCGVDRGKARELMRLWSRLTNFWTSRSHRPNPIVLVPACMLNREGRMSASPSSSPSSRTIIRDGYHGRPYCSIRIYMHHSVQYRVAINKVPYPYSGSTGIIMKVTAYSHSLPARWY